MTDKRMKIEFCPRCGHRFLRPTVTHITDDLGVDWPREYSWCGYVCPCGVIFIKQYYGEFLQGDWSYIMEFPATYLKCIQHLPEIISQLEEPTRNFFKDRRNYFDNLNLTFTLEDEHE